MSLIRLKTSSLGARACTQGLLPCPEGAPTAAQVAFHEEAPSGAGVGGRKGPRVPGELFAEG